MIQVKLWFLALAYFVSVDVDEDVFCFSQDLEP